MDCTNRHRSVLRQGARALCYNPAGKFYALPGVD
jgi:hypothetical protein